MAQEERETIKVRQRQGIEIAKRQGKYHGKVREYGPHSPNRQKRYIYKEACRLLTRREQGEELTKRQIARMLGIAQLPSIGSKSIERKAKLKQLIDKEARKDPDKTKVANFAHHVAYSEIK